MPRHLRITIVPDQRGKYRITGKSNPITPLYPNYILYFVNVANAGCDTRIHLPKYKQQPILYLHFVDTPAYSLSTTTEPGKIGPNESGCNTSPTQSMCQIRLAACPHVILPPNTAIGIMLIKQMPPFMPNQTIRSFSHPR